MSRSVVLELHGRRVRYRDAGRGPAVVLVHGLGLSGDFWDRYFSAFAAAGMRAVAPDLPGFGESEGPRLGLSVRDTARWLLDFADALALARPAWFGHSLGAQPVLRLAADHPGRARALVLASPTGEPVHGRLLRQATGLLRDVGREPLSLVPAVVREYRKTAVGAYLGTWIRAARDDALAAARRVRCPTLLIVGHRDPIVRAAYVTALRRTMRAAHVAYVSHAAHAVIFDQAGAVSRAAIRFLLPHAW